MSYKISYNEPSAEEIEETTHRFQTRVLTEQFVDPGFHLPTIHPNENKCLEALREFFKERANEPIPFDELRSVMYKRCQGPRNARMGQFYIIHALRRMWRAGLIRRFVKDLMAKKYENNKGGKWTGIHYILYPEEE